MSAATGAIRPGKQFADRLLDALSDRERSERTVALILLAYVALWTIYGVIAKGGQDIHVDMSA